MSGALSVMQAKEKQGKTEEMIPCEIRNGGCCAAIINSTPKAYYFLGGFNKSRYEIKNSLVFDLKCVILILCINYGTEGAADT